MQVSINISFDILPRNSKKNSGKFSDYQQNPKRSTQTISGWDFRKESGTNSEKISRKNLRRITAGNTETTTRKSTISVIASAKMPEPFRKFCFGFHDRNLGRKYKINPKKL